MDTSPLISSKSFSEKDYVLSEILSVRNFSITTGRSYTITPKGSQLLFENNLERVISSQKAYKMKNGTVLYREHEKGLNDIRIALIKGAKNIGATVETWISDSDFKKPSIRKQIRVQDPKTGDYFGFQPDGFFVLRLETGERKPFFLEYDNTTMFHKRFSSKIQGYHLLGDVWRKLPVFQEYTDIPVTYRVLTVANAGIERTFHFKQYSVERIFVKDPKRETNTKRFYFTQTQLVSLETIYTAPIWFIPFQSKTKEQKFGVFGSRK